MSILIESDESKVQIQGVLKVQGTLKNYNQIFIQSEIPRNSNQQVGIGIEDEKSGVYPELIEANNHEATTIGKL